MTDRELLQMALDALDLVTDLTTHDDVLYEAIDALRAALAAKEPEPVGYYYNGRFSTEKNAQGIGVYGVPVYTAPPQREWMEQERAVGYREGHQAALKQRVWQGLTDEDIKTMWDNHIIPVFNKNGISPFVFARAVEAKLKEKNND